MQAPEALIASLRQATSHQAPPSLQPLIEAILARYGEAAQALLYYGSCFRKGDDSEGIVDLYLVVDHYRHAYRKPSYALLNALLPPNVFYLEVTHQGEVKRAKYTVFSSRDFQHGATTRRFHSYLWARLAQPMALVYARNEQAAEQVYVAMARAVLTFITRVLPLMPSQFSARKLWCEGLKYTYSAELRAEKPDKLGALFDASPQHYEALTQVAMPMVPYAVEYRSDTPSPEYHAHLPPWRRMSSRLSWTARRLQGKVLSILLLLKASYTFRGGVGYLLWKIERHSGMKVRIDPHFQKVPLLGVAIAFWRLYRAGAFR